MFKRQAVFNTAFRSVIDSPRVTSIQLSCDEKEKTRWETEVLPQVRQCAGGSKAGVPLRRQLPETISFVLADVGVKQQAEVLSSFWREPFMARTTERSVPRDGFRLQHHFELIGRRVEPARHHRMRSRDSRNTGVLKVRDNRVPQRRPNPRPVTIALAHGAGAGMDAPFLALFNEESAAAGSRMRNADLGTG